MQRNCILLWVLLIFVMLTGCSIETETYGEPGPTSIYKIGIDGIGLLELLPTSSEVEYWGPAWSPDGTRVAFSLVRPGDERVPLAMTNADGTNIIQLTNNDRSNYLPAWSPDSNTIVFISQGSDTATAELYRIDVDGNNEIQLTDNDAFEYGASFSPDGSQVVFGSERGGQWQIYTMNADGSKQMPLQTPAHGNAPDWSPDGMQFVFTSDRDGDDDIWIMNVDGSGQRNLTNDLTVVDAWDDNPRWSPDGNRIVFNSWLENVAAVMVLDVESMRVFLLHEPTHLNALIASWSPSGQELVFTASLIERSE